METNKNIGEIFKDNLYDYAENPSNQVWTNIQNSPELIKYNNKASFSYAKLFTGVAVAAVISIASYFAYDNFAKNEDVVVTDSFIELSNQKENVKTIIVEENNPIKENNIADNTIVTDKKETQSDFSNHEPTQSIEPIKPNIETQKVEIMHPVSKMQNVEPTPENNAILPENEKPSKTKKVVASEEPTRSVLSVIPVFASKDTIICRWTSARLEISGAVSVAWSDGSTDFEKMVEPSESSVFVVRATRNDGTDTLIRIFVQVEDCHQIYVPTAFTPDGDGRNDEFLPVHNGDISDYEMVIFTRSGGKVFETKNINYGWDGKISGSQAEEGAYFYAIRYRDSDNKPREQFGQVVLYRSR